VVVLPGRYMYQSGECRCCITGQVSMHHIWSYFRKKESLQRHAPRQEQWEGGKYWLYYLLDIRVRSVEDVLPVYLSG